MDMSHLYSRHPVVYFLIAIVCAASLTFHAYAADYTVTPDAGGFTATGDSTPDSYQDAKAYEVINWAISQAADSGGGTVRLAAGNYEVTDFDTITGDGANWVPATGRSDVTIDNNFTADLPPYLPQGLSVTRISIAGNSGGPQPGLVAYINLDNEVDLDNYRAMAYWLKPNKRIMKAGNVAKFQVTFYQELDAQNLLGSILVYHTEPGNSANHTQWRGHRLPSNPGAQYAQLPSNVRSIGIELLDNNLDLFATDTVLLLDNLTGHNGLIDMSRDKVVLEGEGPYHTILSMKDYGNLPVIYLAAKNAEVRNLQVYGNTDNATLIDYCEGVDSPWPWDLSGTSIHHTFIQQTQGTSITMKGSNTRVYENLLTHSENPMISVEMEGVDIAFNTLKYCTNDSFIYLRYGSNNIVRNNHFSPITEAGRDSGSPDNPASYASQRFNNTIKRGVHVRDGISYSTIKENTFVNLTEQGILLSHGANNITVTENRFYNSHIDNWFSSGNPPYNSHFMNNYFENGSLKISAGDSDEVSGNYIGAESALTLAGTNHYGEGNFIDYDNNATFTDNSSGSSVTTTITPPVLKQIHSGNSWEWGIIHNGGFELGSATTPDSWTGTGDSSYTTNTWASAAQYAVHGTLAVQTEVTGLDAETAEDHRAGWHARSYVRVFPGEALTAQAIVMAEAYQGFGGGSGQEGVRFDIDLYEEDGSPCSTPSVNIGTIAADTPWLRLKNDLTIPAGCTKAVPGVYIADANGRLTADEVKLYRKWTAREIGNSVHLDNASLETFTGTADDQIEDTFDYWAAHTVPPESMLLATSDSIDGNYALEIYKDDLNTSAWTSQQVYTLEPETQYFIEFWTRRDPGQLGHEGRVQLVDVYASPKVWLQDNLMTWSNTNNYLETAASQDTDWTRKAFNFRTPPEGLFSGNVEIRFFNAGVSSQYIDHIRLFRGFGHPSPHLSVATPENLTAITVDDGTINLDWNATNDTGFQNYAVYRALNAAGSFTLVAAGLTMKSHTDTGLDPLTTYHYAVTATDAYGDVSTFSRSAQASTTDTVTILNAKYNPNSGILSVDADTNAPETADLTLAGYGVMDYKTNKGIYEYSERVISDPGAQVTVTSSYGGTAIELLN